MSIKLMTAVTKYGPPNSSHRFVLLMIADNAADDGSNAYPGIETLADKTALSERTVVRAVNALVKGGYLIRQRRKDTTNMYRIVLSKLQPPVNPVSDNLSLTVGDTVSPTQVTPCHPEGCQDVTYEGDTVSPDPSPSNHHSNRPDQPSTTAPAVEPPPPPAVAAAADPVAAGAISVAPAGESNPPAATPADPRPAILDWIEFDDALSDKERATLDTSTLLAWAYWVRLKQAERGSRVYNPVGLVRQQWRKGGQPRADLLRLARGWLALSDDARGRLLGRLEWASGFGQYDPGDPLDEEFPDIPLNTAATVFSATGGELGPPSLMPAPADPPPAPEPSTAPPEDASRLWHTALGVIKMQLPRPTYNQHFAGTTATGDGDGLLVHVRSAETRDWIAARMNGSVQDAVDFVAGRPIPVRYEVRS